MSSEEQEDVDEDIQYFVRIGQTDLDGTKTVERALAELGGVGRRVARIVADEAGVDRTATMGGLEDDAIESVTDAVDSFTEHAPAWLANRQNDFYTGENQHITGTDVELTRDQDINRMRMIRSYKGIRHERGQKVRGQRTKSTGRTEGTIGVNVEAIKEEQAEDDAADGGEE
ncbi:MULTISPECIES: 30S ribosomal protein S13 [Halobacterium]|uniref:Small ribosomal subunit protein uS13 n=5 Tax=Halobacterium salinarum TaxID=2242 RepID=RS13_HALSA|nr:MULTISPECIES: 30S ribosomal protein S13 [Halobacterium]Q9V2W4.1 RecName: Full=Small ribosomal subunit protein uS13; AltName: Full=30S ribosomal protein S13; AltName: Full=HS13 [Halobacterium salinarum NRC-1]AAG19517.1 30S ribosomal protein S13P [Halobacterium salinarum NRC-1]MBB6090202.1 small subunit ribosomal protein S13 [Halobacterium salinarum]MCF2165025.1 30S ribosomal protein S13 [Halobacterium salinarum]MCF2168638.1 30S ribosomal protein S13 [Halobacterium salinarum]MCF2208263.1 30S